MHKSFDGHRLGVVRIRFAPVAVSQMKRQILLLTGMAFLAGKA